MKSIGYIAILAIFAISTNPGACKQVPNTGSLDIIKLIDEFEDAMTSNIPSKAGADITEKYEIVDEVPTTKKVKKLVKDVETLIANAGADVTENVEDIQQFEKVPEIQTYDASSIQTLIAHAGVQLQYEQFQESVLRNVLVNYTGEADCICGEYMCRCCQMLGYGKLRSNYCTDVTYLPSNDQVHATLLLDDYAFPGKSLSIQYPSPMCLVLKPTPMQMCARFFIKKLDAEHVEVCYDVDFFLPDRALLDVHFKCMTLGKGANIPSKHVAEHANKDIARGPSDEPLMETLEIRHERRRRSVDSDSGKRGHIGH